MEFHAFLAKGAAIFLAILAGMFGATSFHPLPPSSFAQATSTSIATSSLSGLAQNGTGFFNPSQFGLGNIASSTIFSPFPFPSSVPSNPPAPNSTPVPPSVIIPPAPSPAPGSVTSGPTAPSAPVDAGITEVKAAIVNILCTSQKTGLRSISGSGEIIDSRGLILTAAHVGQYFLIEKASEGADMSCVIRMGDPAKTLYKATPIYVSQQWVQNNSKAITESQATGNGKNDYAVLAIVSSATGGNLPASFPYLSLGSVTPAKGDPIIIGTYGAEFLTSDQIRMSLSPTIVETDIKNVYTLQVTPVDLISLGASEAAQAGSSGGVVVSNGRAIGVVTTSSLGADLSTRDLRAITIGQIRKSYENETHGSFDLDMQASIASLIQRFAGTEQALADILNQAIDSQ